MDAATVFLDFSVKRLRQHTSEIERCLARLTEAQVWARNTENENAIGNLVLHLCGNVGQRTTAFSGQPDTRVRDLEFTTRGGMNIAALVDHLRSTIDGVIAALEAVTPEGMLRTLTVGDFHYTILEATYHMVAHFSLHTGQIIFATKLLTGENLGFYQPPTK